MFRFCINKTLTTSGVATASPLNNLVAHHLRGPLPACWLLQLRRRDFRAQPNKKSIGLGSTLGPERGDSYDSKMNQFYQDNKMQKLWNNTFERISTFQNVRHHQQQPPHQNQQPQGAPTSNTTDGPTETGNRLKGGPTSASSSMFSLDDQQMMKLSFAEGYFYGQENKKKPRFRLLYIIRETIIFGIIIAIIYSVTNGENPFKRAMSGRSFEIQPEDIDVTFSDVKGCDEAKQELADIVEFLKRPSKFSRLGGKLPKGVLLVGPPGTGKTLLARAVAGEAGVPFFHASGSEFDEILVGQGARRVRDLFDRAKQRTPCVIFIDEIDSIGGKRSSSMFHPYANQTVNQLLSEMDGFAQNEGVIVMGATNRASDLDKALVRPGRFDVQVTVPTPDYKGRKELFEHYLGKVRQARNIDIETLCRTTIGFTGADIENLINQAALKAATENLDIVSQESLEYARDKILMGPERRNRLPDEEQNMMTAYHEAGHALAAHYTEKANPVHKITIVSRGSSLGHTSFLPERDHYSQTKEQLSAFIDVSLGGRVAEELIYGSDRVTSGCSDDLRRANDLATKMVRDFGMSDKIGMRVVRDDESQTSSQVVISNFSDATSELVDSEISKLLADSRKRVENLLTEHRNELVMLAEALVKYETLDSAEMKLVLEGKDPRVLRQERERERRNKLNNLKPPERLPLDLLK